MVIRINIHFQLTKLTIAIKIKLKINVCFIIKLIGKNKLKMAKAKLPAHNILKYPLPAFISSFVSYLSRYPRGIAQSRTTIASIYSIIYLIN